MPNNILMFICLFASVVALKDRAYGSQTQKKHPPVPLCTRPLDMANSKLVKQYWECLKQKQTFCDQYDDVKECLSFLKKPVDYGKRFPSNPEDINPAERCSIFKDGSYKCLQDPVRFVAKQAVPQGPISMPSASSDSDSTTLPTSGSTPSGPISAVPNTAPSAGQPK